MQISTPIFAAAVVLAALSFGARADTSTDGRNDGISGRRHAAATLLLVRIPDHWTTLSMNAAVELFSEL